MLPLLHPGDQCQWRELEERLALPEPLIPMLKVSKFHPLAVLECQCWQSPPPLPQTDVVQQRRCRTALRRMVRHRSPGPLCPMAKSPERRLRDPQAAVIGQRWVTPAAVHPWSDAAKVERLRQLARAPPTWESHVLVIAGQKPVSPSSLARQAHPSAGAPTVFRLEPAPVALRMVSAVRHRPVPRRLDQLALLSRQPGVVRNPARC